jgi:hypothetical protein
VAAEEGVAEIEVELSGRDVAVMLATGFARRDGDVLVLTERGSAWLREWCAARLAERDKGAAA